MNKQYDSSTHFKVGDIITTEYTVTNEKGRTEFIKMGGIINAIDFETNSCEVILNNKLIIWSGIEEIELIFSKDNQDFVKTVINQNSKNILNDTTSPEHNALEILLKLDNDNIHKLLYRELNKEVVGTLDNIGESYELDQVKTIIDAMKSLALK